MLLTDGWDPKACHTKDISKWQLAMKYVMKSLIYYQTWELVKLLFTGTGLFSKQSQVWLT